ncbi:fluoride efflux transporter CrcB [Nonomuraea sp. MCN248]|uniref:Fluoride-specific ion channel FluC n=1 Tax=Nonomuraea corallina TaxID=2989783 RepID=A0ABT4SBN2_9ACTN|nr:fluoride efflux transporter CrcB [Nonomuraea corallina]MDA0634385.1 fluoride efflux transporter CrcB [Nonomuraea corallina]
MITVLVVFIGGLAGAPTRWLVDSSVKKRFGSALPWGTLTVNVLGSAILGFLMGLSSVDALSHTVLSLIGTGFCGALTTFSTFSTDTYKLLTAGSTGKALVNIGMNLVAGLAAVSLCYLLGRAVAG